MADSELTKLLKERGSTHGDMISMSALIQTLQRAVHMSPNWLAKNVVTRVVIDMFMVKSARIVEGDETFEEHWTDIMGYAEKGRELRNSKTPEKDYTGGRKPLVIETKEEIKDRLKGGNDNV
jgi:hypothetical protein